MRTLQTATTSDRPPQSKLGPAAQNSSLTPTPQSRLISLDFFRGFTMFLLIAESTDIYDLLVSPELNGTLLGAIGTQFHHHPWNGLRFWDLIQPAFMFMVGVAMPFSLRQRAAAGESGGARLGHALWRALALVLLGVFLATSSGERTEWMFTNVLAQIGLGYFFVYLLLRFKWPVHAIACVVILGGYWYFMQIGYWQRSGQPRPHHARLRQSKRTAARADAEGGCRLRHVTSQC